MVTIHGEGILTFAVHLQGADFRQRIKKIVLNATQIFVQEESDQFIG